MKILYYMMFALATNQALAQSADCPDTFVKCAMRAAKGDPIAQYQVGYSMMLGKGTLKNEREGVAFIRASAMGGNIAAYLPLCIAYSKGQVVPTDYIEAYTWCHLSGKLTNHETALHNLRFLSGKMNQAQIDESMLRIQAMGLNALQMIQNGEIGDRPRFRRPDNTP